MVDDANRLLADDAFNYAYDANGNLTSKVALAGGDITTYVYNALDQLTRIDFPDGSFAKNNFEDMGLFVDTIEDVDTFLNRVLGHEVDGELHSLADKAERNKSVEIGTFHIYVNLQ